MYQAQAAVFMYAISPVHMGAGTAFGLIDSPIQRERHTDHPVLAGSGLKGAVRHHLQQQAGWDRGLINRLFGPDEGNLHAGAVSFGDAQIVAFPVRSAKRGYVWITSALALARLHRLLSVLGQQPDWQVPADLNEMNCRCVAATELLGDNGKLHLEAFEFTPVANDTLLKPVAEWLAQHALPRGIEACSGFFADKLKLDLVQISDTDFTYFTRNATLVEPHVRIDNKTGTAADGGLFYVENLPPESLMVCPLLASQERSGHEAALAAQAVVTHLSGALDGKLVQVGGDATTGRGQMLVTFNAAN